ncbi:MAG: ATPase [Candidatus Magnetoglobus multicellularis str. Araruama]|uniref:Replication-associated recombination protein A n=1 Tax=Candidatus Magnetoglobus multicellularis str. Araruama TaxID=890399 RepID=A0A1V1P6T0_9BACT|nr:MAG: ATPase [Candidatus Magnetoglobus multicellularis str. Araruama]
MDLFDHRAQKESDATRPLAEKMRPKTLDGYVGQSHLVGEGAVIWHALKSDQLFSMILWGPPGCGKTTLARMIAAETKAHFMHFSAVLSGVKEIRSVIESAKEKRKYYQKKTVLFVDEIHRFNKAQQDAFLHHVENGLITLIGATTENPSFEIIAPLISRCRVLVLESLSDIDIQKIIQNALDDSHNGFGFLSITLTDDAMAYLVGIADGDARSALNGLELVVQMAVATHNKADNASIKIDTSLAREALQHLSLNYDKTGENHYNLISAFHKSLRGGDPDASLYWFTRMIVSGEDPLYVARRMVRFASEDIGCADPHALNIALNAMQAFQFLGHPEGELCLAQAAIYLACAPKSNRIYEAYKRVKADIRQTGTLPVPMHIRNAPTPLMKNLGYGKGYQYPHDNKHALANQKYLPDQLAHRKYYEPSERGYELVIKKRLAQWKEMLRKS